MSEFSPEHRSGAERHGGRTKLLVTVTTYVTMIPYIGLAAWLWSHNGNTASYVLAVYAALMFVYTGAVQWGWALAERPSMRIYGWSMLALVVGWILASLPWYSISLILLAIATSAFWNTRGARRESSPPPGRAWTSRKCASRGVPPGPTPTARLRYKRTSEPHKPPAHSLPYCRCATTTRRPGRCRESSSRRS